MKTYIQALKWTTGIYHLLLIPFCFLFLSRVNLYAIPLLLLIVLHITTILLSKKAGMNTSPHYIGIIGIIVTLVAFFPYIDIVLHIIAAVFLLLDAVSTNKKEVCDS
ncbi:hypothetical protein OCA08_16675 [Bacillus cereus]|nr:hypothetical protein [Bacillus cereus]